MLEVHKLTKRYPLTSVKVETNDSKPVSTLENLSLQVQKGEFVSIVGPSGCGKSTLFNLISGLETPDHGEIFLNGTEITGKRGHVSYMLQKDLLFPWRTILENCLLGMEIQGVPRTIAREKARTLLAEFNLSSYENSYPRVLSGGMRQKVAFLRTMLANKEILLLDEPFGALDAYTKSEMQSWLTAVWGKYGLTILFITHDVEEALFLSDRIYVLSAGPARVNLTMTVDLPRPRLRQMIVNGDFIRLKKQLLQTLFGEN